MAQRQNGINIAEELFRNLNSSNTFYNSHVSSCGLRLTLPPRFGY